MIIPRPVEIEHRCLHTLLLFCRWKTRLAALSNNDSCRFRSGDYALAQDLNLNPTRTTIANGATIQPKGVQRVEVGYNAYPGER
jgi:hypothetical protein